MLKPQGIVVCVDYDDLLAMTLPANLRHLSSCVVVTAPHDEATQRLCNGFDKVRVHVTDAFYRYGATFNKGLAIEEGFDVLGRWGWILVWDADTLFPRRLRLQSVQCGHLYGARRRVCPNPLQHRDNLPWRRWRVHKDREIAGYFQLFHAADQHIAERPWYEVTFTHAGGGDGYFQSRWPADRKHWLPAEVLHFGPVDTNWFGRASRRIDGRKLPGQQVAAQQMRRFLRFKGWRRRRTVTEFCERVDVPGAPDTGYTLGKKRPPQ